MSPRRWATGARCCSRGRPPEPACSLSLPITLLGQFRLVGASFRHLEMPTLQRAVIQVEASRPDLPFVCSKLILAHEVSNGRDCMSSHRRDRPVILLTGFGPFPGAPRNVSGSLIQALVEIAPRRLPGFAVHAEILPTEWQAGPHQLASLLDRLEPAIVLHFGVSHRARGFVVETRALNLRRDILDACGEAPDDVCVISDGPRELRATLPTGLIVDMLRRKGLPVQLSRDAGGYLCNAILYHSLEAARRRALEHGTLRRIGARGGVRRGFIHIPDRLAGAQTGKARRARSSLLDWDQAIEGGVSIMELAAGVAGHATV